MRVCTMAAPFLWRGLGGQAEGSRGRELGRLYPNIDRMRRCFIATKIGI
jgi:hypothetical protein